MADKRECYAGDLMSDMLGKRIATKSRDGQVVDGVLMTVSHILTGPGGKLTIIRVGETLTDYDTEAIIVDEVTLVEVFA